MPIKDRAPVNVKQIPGTITYDVSSRSPLSAAKHMGRLQAVKPAGGHRGHRPSDAGHATTCLPALNIARGCKGHLLSPPRGVCKLKGLEQLCQVKRL